MTDTYYQDWYRRTICEPEHHVHDDEDDFLRCIIDRLAFLQQVQGRGVSSLPGPR